MTFCMFMLCCPSSMTLISEAVGDPWRVIKTGGKVPYSNLASIPQGTQNIAFENILVACLYLVN